MRTLSLAILVLALAACGDSTPRNLNSLVEQGETHQDRSWLDPVTMQPFSGEVFIPDPRDSTRVSGRGFLTEGIRDGVWTEYLRGG